MGMKYTVTENRLRYAVRHALLNSGHNKWTLNEGFISMFFGALSNAYKDLASQYKQDQQREVAAKFLLTRKNLVAAIGAEMEAKGLSSQRGGMGSDKGQFSQYRGFAEYDWSDKESNTVITEVMTNRMNESLPRATRTINAVAAMPAIPGITKDGQSPVSDSKDEGEQADAIKKEAQTQNKTIDDAAQAVTFPFGDIATLFSGTSTYDDLEMLIKDAGFGFTPVDFLHKVKHIDTIVRNANYGSAKFPPEISSLVKKACLTLRRDAETGLSKYEKQGNYKEMSPLALPSEAIQGKAAPQTGGESAEGSETTEK